MNNTQWGLDPNSDHQLWSHWTFTIIEAGRCLKLNDVEYNSATWLRKGFGSTGQARISKTAMGWKIECDVEGPPAHDPDYVQSVETMFDLFVERGWGIAAIGKVEVKIMAGDAQDGVPRAQLIVMPAIVGQDLGNA